MPLANCTVLSLPRKTATNWKFESGKLGWWPVLLLNLTSQVLETWQLERGVDGTCQGEEACGGNLVLYSELAGAFFSLGV